jgi:hypothetical protein
MSCRARRVFSVDAAAIEALARSGPYLELARTGRRDDFAWLAQSQGVPADKIDELWRAVLAMLTPAPRPTS